MYRFINRRDAGKVLAEQLRAYKNQPNTIVLALPRGGVPVAYEIAEALSLPLDIFIVRKLGVPGHEELAMGAMASGGTMIFNDDVLQQISVSDVAMQQVIQAEQQELQRREGVYRGQKIFPNLKNQTIILVDDGIATGASIKAAIKALRQYHPRRIVLAVPVAARSIGDEMSLLADHFICPLQPRELNAVGAWYEDFSQTSDEEVIELLNSISSSH